MNSLVRFFHRIVAVSTIVSTASSLPAQNPRHIDFDPQLTAVKSLSQNWSDDESNWFYNAAQGSRLVPYQWFIHLEQPDSQKSFLDAEHIRGLGYIARKPSPDNPDGLPIGFIKDASYEGGTEGMGLTCAACHTGQINFNKTAYLIDGGPTMGNLEKFLKRLAKSLNLTAADDDKFERFADKVTPGATEHQKKAMRSALKSNAVNRDSYNQRNLPSKSIHRFGYGRVDAFGAIFNEVSATFLGIPDNVNPASAPVSYPCLWDAPQHDRVQWNGAAENRVSELGIALFGTREVGALGRNSGEVLGVFGHAEINAHELVPQRYPSTVNKRNLLKIEDTLKTLWSPRWPDEFGTPVTGNGAAIYDQNCKECHALIQRDAADRKVTAWISDEGTDTKMLENFMRVGQTGLLQGRRKTLLGHEHFKDVEPIALILKHVVERVMLKALPVVELETKIAGHFEDVNALNPGFQSTAMVSVGDKQVRVSFDTLERTGDSIRVKASNSNLLDFAHEISSKLENNRTIFDSLGAARDRLKNRLRLDDDDEETSSVAEVKHATARVGYKARPLNGIWATAPYLHNGSVPTLTELLKRVKDRKEKFHVGSLEYDPVNVGFVDDPDYPEFNTLIEGNRNTGHEHGVDLTEPEKRDLIEFLKTL